MLLLITASLSATLACSSSSGSSGSSDASTFLPAEDASMVPCTSQGGVCQPYSASCPVLQQNATLCGDSVLICCLPEGGGVIEPPPDSGSGPADASSDDAGD
jgi:hypothetical protein